MQELQFQTPSGPNTSFGSKEIAIASEGNKIVDKWIRWSWKKLEMNAYTRVTKIA